MFMFCLLLYSLLFYVHKQQHSLLNLLGNCMKQYKTIRPVLYQYRWHAFLTIVFIDLDLVKVPAFVLHLSDTSDHIQYILVL